MALTTAEWVILGAAVIAGSAVQSSLGFGLNVVVAPVAALIDPQLVPAPLLLLGTLHVAGLGWAERGNLRLRLGWWVLLGRFPGVAIAVWLLASVSIGAIEVLFGVMLLSVIALSFVRRIIHPTRATLVAAGVVSGVSGTTVAVGGPPVALVFAESPTARADITSVIVIGTATSLAGLALAGEIGGDDVRIAAALIPAMLFGFVAGRFIAPRLNPDRTRVTVYAIATIAAVAVLLRGLF